MAARTTGATLQTKENGDELARLIRVSSFGTGLKHCQFSNHIGIYSAEDQDLDERIPAVFVIPAGVTFTEEIAQARAYEVEDEYRIVYLFSAKDPTTDLLDSSSDDMESIVEALALDANLDSLSLAGATDSVDRSRPLGVEWFPPEDEFLGEGVAVKAVVVRWSVIWRARTYS